MVNITSWFASVDQKCEEDKRKATNRLTEKNQRRFGMSEIYTLDGGCTVLKPPASIWLNKQRLNRVQT